MRPLSAAPRRSPFRHLFPCRSRTTARRRSRQHARAVVLTSALRRKRCSTTPRRRLGACCFVQGRGAPEDSTGKRRKGGGSSLFFKHPRRATASRSGVLSRPAPLPCSSARSDRRGESSVLPRRPAVDRRPRRRASSTRGRARSFPASSGPGPPSILAGETGLVCRPPSQASLVGTGARARCQCRR